MAEHRKKIEEIPRSRFLTSLNPILKRQLNWDFDQLLAEFLKSQNNAMRIERIEFQKDMEQFSVFLKVIGDPLIVLILTAIDGETTVNELSRQTGLSAPTVYRKVERLYDVGLVVKMTAKDNVRQQQVVYSKTVNSISLEISEKNSKIVILPKKGPMCLQRILYLI